MVSSVGTSSVPSSSITSTIAQLDDAWSQAGPSNSNSSKAGQSSTLKRKQKNVDISTPALMAILPPSRKRTRLQWLTQTHLERSRSEHQSQLYNPTSREDLIKRIASYNLTAWSDRKPDGCGAVEMAKRGWRCTGKKREEVTCDLCHATWVVPSSMQASRRQSAGADTSSGAELDHQRDICEKHTKPCPWRAKGCPDTLYSLPLLAPPDQLLRQVIDRAATISTDVEIEIKHQLDKKKLSRCLDMARERLKNDDAQRSIPEASLQIILTVALCGWAAISSQSRPATPTSSGSMPSSPISTASSSLLLGCELCARRIAVKGKMPAHTDQGQSNGNGTAVSPNKLSTVDLFSSHRRFCPYIMPAGSSTTGCEALLDRILHQRHTNPDTAQAPIPFSRNSDELKPTSAAQTRAALQYVRETLGGGCRRQ